MNNNQPTGNRWNKPGCWSAILWRLPFPIPQYYTILPTRCSSRLTDILILIMVPLLPVITWLLTAVRTLYNIALLIKNNSSFYPRTSRLYSVDWLSRHGCHCHGWLIGPRIRAPAWRVYLFRAVLTLKTLTLGHSRSNSNDHQGSLIIFIEKFLWLLWNYPL